MRWLVLVFAVHALVLACVSAIAQETRPEWWQYDDTGTVNQQQDEWHRFERDSRDWIQEQDVQRRLRALEYDEPSPRLPPAQVLD